MNRDHGDTPLGATAKKKVLILSTMRTEPIRPTLPPYTSCSVRITAKMSIFLRLLNLKKNKIAGDNRSYVGKTRECNRHRC